MWWAPQRDAGKKGHGEGRKECKDLRMDGWVGRRMDRLTAFKSPSHIQRWHSLPSPTTLTYHLQDYEPFEDRDPDLFSL